MRLQFWQPVGVKALNDFKKNPLLIGDIEGDAIGLEKHGRENWQGVVVRNGLVTVSIYLNSTRGLRTCVFDKPHKNR